MATVVDNKRLPFQTQPSIAVHLHWRGNSPRNGQRRRPPATPANTDGNWVWRLPSTLENSQVLFPNGRYRLQRKVMGHTFTNSKENTEEVTYERNFNVSVSLWSANKSFLFLRLRPSCKETCSFSSIVQWVVLESNSEQRFPYEWNVLQVRQRLVPIL